MVEVTHQCMTYEIIESLGMVDYQWVLDKLTGLFCRAL